MALDLLYNRFDVPRCYCNDRIESFIWVFAWVTVGSASTTVNGQGDYVPGQQVLSSSDVQNRKLLLL